MAGRPADALLVAARGGDERAFVELTAPHRAALHRHCYRLLGSLFDADDALQETLLRAWRAIGGYAPRAPLSAWLFRIATNVCLRALEQRRRRPGEAPDSHLEPYPDELLDELPAAGPGPADVVVEREQIGLALVAAMQLLPARQRIAVVLKDVLDWPVSEIAAVLETTDDAVASALQRARRTLAREAAAPTLAHRHAPASGAAAEAVMRRFQDAWARVDIEALVALLSDDCLLTMPPESVRIEGRDAVGAFFATVPVGGRLDRIPLAPAAANRQPALAAYADEHDEGVHRAYGVMVFAIVGERIASITGFPREPLVFERLGLPLTHPSPTAGS